MIVSLNHEQFNENSNKLNNIKTKKKKMRCNIKPWPGHDFSSIFSFSLFICNINETREITPNDRNNDSDL